MSKSRTGVALMDLKTEEEVEAAIDQIDKWLDSPEGTAAFKRLQKKWKKAEDEYRDLDRPSVDLLRKPMTF